MKETCRRPEVQLRPVHKAPILDALQGAQGAMPYKLSCQRQLRTRVRSAQAGRTARAEPCRTTSQVVIRTQVSG